MTDTESPSATESPSDVALLELASHAASKLREAIATRVVGQDAVVELMLTALLARGHALLVGVPGLAKTLLVSSLADALDLGFGRVQFTPDLLPADLTGTDVLHESTDEHGRSVRQIKFLPGPIFRNLVLADEIDRTPPKTQAALLEAMQERRVTSGGTTHKLPDPFQVFATRNPIEQEGTYPLPEAQLDRFLLEIHVGYPSLSEEREVARRTTGPLPGAVPQVMSARELSLVQGLIPRVPVTDKAIELAVALTRATRPGDPLAQASFAPMVRFGAGPRGSQALVLAAKARAVLHGNAAADIDDVRALAIPVLRHRLVLSYRAEAEGVREVDVLAALLEKVR